MTHRVQTTESALADVVQIGNWIISQGAPDAAGKWVSGLMATLRSLEVMPERCSVAPESSECEGEIRQLVFGDYRVLLTVRDECVFVLHVRHGRRRHATLQDLSAALAESTE